MKKYLHNTDELFDSPQFGWEQMQSLLEKNLPEQKGRRSMPLLTLFIAASFIILFLLSSLLINNQVISFPPREKVEVIDGQNTVTGKVPVAPASQLAESNISYPVRATDFYNSIGQGTNDAPPSLNEAGEVLPSVPANKILLTGFSRSWDDLSISYVNTFKLKDENINIAAEKNSMNDSTKVIANKKNKKGSWELFAGLAMNAVIGEQQNLRPYPAATLNYNISDKFFVSLGLTATSPVAVSSKGIDKTVYLNDTARNVNFYNNVKHYTRLSYADIPLTAAVKLNKRWAVKAGVQASVLLNTKTTTSIEQYDFQMAMSNGVPGNMLSGAAAVSEKEYTVEARKMDYRFNGGIQYHLNGTTFSLTYQYAPRPALTGDHVSRSKNELISIGAQVRLR